jgi:tetratricopeptide (TPR) repeat protein
MTANSFDWDEELPPETEDEVYRALLLALQRKQGFGLFFVQCSKSQGERIVTNLRRDLPQRIQKLHLQGEVTTLYDQIATLWQEHPFDVLVLEGLEASLYAYEDVKRLSGWSSEEIYNYSWKGVPKILNHLNQQREHLRNDFPARFVFLMPPFVVDYFIQRAADFLDWRSGLFCFPHDPREIAKEADRFVADGGYNQYLKLTPQERIEKILNLKTVLKEISSDSKRQAQVLVELGRLFQAEQDYENAIASYDRAVAIKPNDHEALHLQPDFANARYNKACCYGLQGETVLAIETLKQAIALDAENRELAKTDPDFDRIRNDERFQALIEESHDRGRYTD